MLKSMQKNGLRLSLFALVCTGAIVFTDYATHDVIAVQQQEKQLEMFKQALEHSNNRPLQPLNGRVIVQ